jgi:hypothetical protein
VEVRSSLELFVMPMVNASEVGEFSARRGFKEPFFFKFCDPAQSTTKFFFKIQRSRGKFLEKEEGAAPVTYKAPKVATFPISPWHIGVPSTTASLGLPTNMP